MEENMGIVKYIWTDDYVGQRVGLEIPEEGNRAKPFSEKYWSQMDILPLSRLKEIQLQKLQHLLKFAYENSPFYRRKWDEAGVRPEDVKTLEDFQKFPVLKKSDFEKDQEEFPPYGSACTSPPNTQSKYWQTSGSTGKPRLWSDTKEDLENDIFKISRFLYSAGVRPGWRAFYAFPYPPFNGFWLTHYSTDAMGCQNVPKGSIATTTWLGMIKNLAGTAPSLLATTPTFAMRQIEVAKEMGVNPHELKISVICMAGEAGATVPATKKILEEAWGAKIFDLYGSTENGAIGSMCDSQSELEEPSDHLFMDYQLVELIDPDTCQPVEPGQPGAICITSLSKFGMPCIKYSLGDLVRIEEGSPCGCGRTLPLIKGGIQARADDMIIVKGENIYPSLIEECVRSVAGLSIEYRIQKTLMSATILVEAAPDIPKAEYPELAKTLQARIKDKAYVNLEINVMEPNTLPREMAKTKRVVQ